MLISKLSSKRLEELALKTGLQVDKGTGILFGRKLGYDICLRTTDNSYKSLLSFSVSCNGNAPEKNEFIQFTKEQSVLGACNVSQYSVSFIITPGRTKAKCIEKIVTAMNVVIEYLQLRGYENCCEACGGKEDINTYILNGTEVITCSSCFNAHTYSAEIQETEKKQRENVAAGIVGALIGSIAGVIAIIIFGQLGYVAAISGFVMAICTLKGYERLAGRLGGIGIVVSCFMIFIMIYMGCRLDWAVSIMSFYEVDIATAFQAAGDSSVVEMSAFIENLLLLYLFSLVGGVPTIWKTIRSNKCENISHKMEF
ncbi:hypothetical protein [Anaerosporobacter sp.]